MVAEGSRVARELINQIGILALQGVAARAVGVRQLFGDSSKAIRQLTLTTEGSPRDQRADGGSRTPPIPTPPERCTSLPIWAHEPTVAQVSTIVPAPTQAPMFTYPGITTTPGSQWAP